MAIERPILQGVAALRASLPETIAQRTRVAEAALGEALHAFVYQRNLIPEVAEQGAKAAQKLDKRFEMVTVLDKVGIRAENPFNVHISSARWSENLEVSGTRFQFLDLKGANFHKFTLYKPNDTIVPLRYVPEELTSVLSGQSKVTMQYLYSRPGAVSPHIHDIGPSMPVSAQQIKVLLDKGDNAEAVTQALFTDRSRPAALNLHVSNPAESLTYHFDRALSMSRSAKPTVIDDQLQRSRVLVEDIQARNRDHYERLADSGRNVAIQFESDFRRPPWGGPKPKVQPVPENPIGPYDRSGYSEVTRNPMKAEFL